MYLASNKNRYLFQRIAKTSSWLNILKETSKSLTPNALLKVPKKHQEAIASNISCEIRNYIEQTLKL